MREVIPSASSVRTPAQTTRASRAFCSALPLANELAAVAVKGAQANSCRKSMPKKSKTAVIPGCCHARSRARDERGSYRLVACRMPPARSEVSALTINRFLLIYGTSGDCHGGRAHHERWG